MRQFTFIFLIYFAIPDAVFAVGNCKSVAECAQQAQEAAYQAKLALQIAVPKGAVMPFNLDECPRGWVPFPQLNGRVIVGSGHGRGLTNRKFKQSGGVEKHPLSIQEMPKHAHNLPYVPEVSNLSGGSYPVMSDTRHPSPSAARRNAPTHDAGAGSPHNNMQPYYVLTYCERR